MVHNTRSEFRLSVSNIVALELPKPQLKYRGVKQSFFLTFEVGNVSAVSTIQTSAGPSTLWDENIQLCIDEEHWTNPETLLTILVQVKELSSTSATLSVVHAPIW